MYSEGTFLIYVLMRWKKNLKASVWLYGRSLFKETFFNGPKLNCGHLSVGKYHFDNSVNVQKKILVHLYYCSAFFKCCKKDVQSIRISFTIIFLCLNRFSKNILKSDISEIRVRSWVQVVSRQRNRPLIGWSIWSNN